MNKSVEVFLSYYNGQEYIEDQIRSLSAQDDVSLKVSIRCDGNSPDNNLIGRLNKIHKNIFWDFGPNIGYARSFLSLVKSSDECADLYAFSDQDDVWISSKLSRACIVIEEMNCEDTPLLYICTANIVNSEMELIEKFKCVDPREGIFSICENLYPGHLMVFNRSLLILLRKINENKILCHDWIAYIVASLAGRVIVDNNFVGVLYRQHNNNVLGAPSLMSLLQRKFRGLFKLRGTPKLYTSDQAREVYFSLYDYIDPEKREDLAAYFESRDSFFKRLTLIFSGKIGRINFIDDFLFKVQVLIGIY